MRCAICSGELELLYAGAGDGARAEAFSPTNHRPGEHGDLYRCERCGTVQQPALPHGDELLELYREMRDEHYLDEEDGRRRTARRLLHAIGERVAEGRLLDVGCGHGLLLDEARRAGYEVEGVELSTYALAHARGRLGLRVHEELPTRERYDVVVLADVLEHVEDPLATLDRCRELLNAGGVLCIVTPDPSSRTAKLAGSRWWGYLPAHTYLIPRAKLKDLIEERGLAVTGDVPLVRTFSLRYWMAGLAERGGAVGRSVEALRRITPQRARVSLSLGDERVLIAQKGVAERRVHEPARAAPAPA